MKSSVDNLNSRRWKLVRREALERASWRCKKCGKSGRLQVDHIKPISQGGDGYLLSNLQPLCISCHLDKTAAERGVTQEQLAWRAYQREIDLKLAKR